MFGYVCNEMKEFMFFLILFVYKLVCCLSEVCKEDIFLYFCFDGKIQVMVEYDENNKFVCIDVIVILIQYYFEIMFE